MRRRSPWLWSGPSRVVYLVDGGAQVDRQGSENGRRPGPDGSARTLPSGVAEADGDAVGGAARSAPTGGAPCYERASVTAEQRARLEAKGYRLTVGR